MRIVIGEDSVLVRAGAVRLLEDAGLEVVGQAGDGEELLRKVRAHRPDVAIVDIRMPPDHLDEGLRAAEVIRRELAETGVLVLSQHVEEEYVMRLMAQGTGGLATCSRTGLPISTGCSRRWPVWPRAGPCSTPRSWPTCSAAAVPPVHWTR